MAQKVDLGLAFGLPPKKAIRYFRSKGHVVSWNWNDTLGAAHAKAFTVAKVTNMEVVPLRTNPLTNPLTRDSSPLSIPFSNPSASSLAVFPVQ